MFLVALRSGIISKDTGLVNIPAGSLLDGLWTPPPVPTTVPPVPPLATLASWEPDGREKQAVNYYTWLLSQSNMSIRGHNVALLLAKSAVNSPSAAMTSTLSLRHSFPWRCKGLAAGKKGNTGINILTNALILHRLLTYLHECTHRCTHKLGKRQTESNGDNAGGSHQWLSKVCPTFYLITAMVRVTTLLALCGYILAG